MYRVGVLAKIAQLFGGQALQFFNERQKLRHELKVAELTGQIAAERSWAEWRVKNIDADAAWESQSIANSGWKDEYVLVLLSIPLVLVFVPYTADYVMRGFEILQRTPDWYRWLVTMIFAAVYGIRIWRRKI